MDREQRRALRKTMKALDDLVMRQNRQLVFEISQRENIPLERMDAFLEEYCNAKKYRLIL